MVSVEPLPAVTEVGLKLAVAPEGTPLAESDTVPAAPDVNAVDTLDVVPAPAATDALVGLRLMEKSLVAAALTPSENVVLCDLDPSAPATVMV